MVSSNSRGRTNECTRAHTGHVEDFGRPRNVCSIALHPQEIPPSYSIVAAFVQKVQFDLPYLKIILSSCVIVLLAQPPSSCILSLIFLNVFRVCVCVAMCVRVCVCMCLCVQLHYNIMYLKACPNQRDSLIYFTVRNWYLLP